MYFSAVELICQPSCNVTQFRFTVICEMDDFVCLYSAWYHGALKC